MQNDIPNQNVEEINLSEIDWNNLTIPEFNSIERRLQENKKQAKKQHIKSGRNTGLVFINLKGNTYQIKEVDFHRLKNMKSDKSKQKMIDDIIAKVKPIENL